MPQHDTGFTYQLSHLAMQTFGRSQNPTTLLIHLGFPKSALHPSKFSPRQQASQRHHRLNKHFECFHPHANFFDTTAERYPLIVWIFQFSCLLGCETRETNPSGFPQSQGVPPLSSPLLMITSFPMSLLDTPMGLFPYISFI